ncbi:MAG: hypothetical protein ABJA83_11180 [Burkholderiaceae bacterium]
MNDDDPTLKLSVRELLERAARLIVKQSTQGPDFDRRIDLFYDVDLKDHKLGRKHRVRVRLKVTAASLIFADTVSKATKVE